jgi:hypothetical protein
LGFLDKILEPAQGESIHIVEKNLRLVRAKKYKNLKKGIMKLLPKKLLNALRLDKEDLGINENNKLPRWLHTEINHGILRIYGTPLIEHEGITVI